MVHFKSTPRLRQNQKLQDKFKYKDKIAYKRQMLKQKNHHFVLFPEWMR